MKDKYGRTLLAQKDLCKILYRDPELDIAKIALVDPESYNESVRSTYLDLPLLEKISDLQLDTDEFHKLQQQKWFMPDEYQTMDIARLILDSCNGNQAELQRCGMELLEYARRDLLPLLCYLKYLVDTMRENNIVWGVGRGSSVASFVLYKIGLHKIDSIKYDLDFYEFMK